MADHTDRLVAQITSRTAPFQSSYPSGSSFLPTNMSGTPFKALNSLTLAAEASSAGYRDPRWVTRRVAENLGATIRPSQPGSTLQYWQRLSSGGSKMSTAVVYNAEQVRGLPPYERQMADVQARVKAVDIAAHIAAAAANPSRMGRDLSPTQTQLRKEIATMFVSDRLQIGFQGNPDRQFAQAVSELVRDRGEIARAAMIGERIAQDAMNRGFGRQPELSQTNRVTQEAAWRAIVTSPRSSEAPQQAQTLALRSTL